MDLRRDGDRDVAAFEALAETFGENHWALQIRISVTNGVLGDHVTVSMLLSFSHHILETEILRACHGWICLSADQGCA